jgi:putative multiple sugar transport system ATP-binding protein
VIDWRRSPEAARELLARVGLRRETPTPRSRTSASASSSWSRSPRRSKSVKLLILDEPTAALNESDSQHLLDLILHLKGQGRHVHHHQPQAQRDRRIADEITIIRDGKSIETLNVPTASTRTASSAAWWAARWNQRFPDARPEDRRGVLRGEELDGPAPAGSTGPHGVQELQLQCPPRRGRGLRRPHGRRPHRTGMSVFGRTYGRSSPARSTSTARKSTSTSSEAIDATAWPTSPRTASTGPEPARRHQADHLSAALHKISKRGCGWQQGIHRGQAVPQELRIKTPSVEPSWQALRRQPAEGGPGQVDVHRPRPADPGRAHPRHRRRRQVRDLRHHPAAGRARARASSSSPPSSPSCWASPTASTPSSKAPSPASWIRTRPARKA